MAAICAAVQLFLCKKAKSSFTKLLPLFFSAGALLLAAFIRGENFLASAVYGIFGQGIFAVIVLLWFAAGALGIGGIIGWAVYLFSRKK